MTVGLLTSRRTKNKLFAKAASEPSDQNINRYKLFKTIYQRTIRAAKKLHISDTLRENANNPKKTWQTLNELLGKKAKSDSVSQININGAVNNYSKTIVNTMAARDFLILEAGGGGSACCLYWKCEK